MSGICQCFDLTVNICVLKEPVTIGAGAAYDRLKPHKTEVVQTLSLSKNWSMRPNLAIAVTTVTKSAHL